MGINVYSLRSDTRIIDGIEIARYGCAYKVSSRFSPAEINRATSVGEKALAKIGDRVSHYIIGEWAHIGDTELRIYPVAKVHKLAALSHDGQFRYGDRQVGYLIREGRRIVFKKKTPEAYEVCDAVAEYIDQVLPLLPYSVVKKDLPAIDTDKIRKGQSHRIQVRDGLRWIDSIPRDEMDRITSQRALVGFDRDWVEAFMVT